MPRSSRQLVVDAPVDLEAAGPAWPDEAALVGVTVVHSDDGKSNNVVALETLFCEVARVRGCAPPNVGWKWSEGRERRLCRLAVSAAKRASLADQKTKATVLARIGVFQLDRVECHVAMVGRLACCAVAVTLHLLCVHLSMKISRAMLLHLLLPHVLVPAPLPMSSNLLLPHVLVPIPLPMSGYLLGGLVLVECSLPSSLSPLSRRCCSRCGLDSRRRSARRCGRVGCTRNCVCAACTASHLRGKYRMRRRHPVDCHHVVGVVGRCCAWVAVALQLRGDQQERLADAHLPGSLPVNAQDDVVVPHACRPRCAGFVVEITHVQERVAVRPSKPEAHLGPPDAERSNVRLKLIHGGVTANCSLAGLLELFAAAEHKRTKLIGSSRSTKYAALHRNCSTIKQRRCGRTNKYDILDGELQLRWWRMVHRI